MLQCKTFEVRDRGTFVPCFAVLASPRDLIEDPRIHLDAEFTRDIWLLRRAGYGEDRRCVLFGNLHSGYVTHDSHNQHNRTMQVAHRHVEENWDSLSSGDVIDVEFVLGETRAAKQSERLS